MKNKMTEEIKYISDLILKVIIGNASNEDKKHLLDWRNRSSDNEELYQKILSKQKIHESFKVYDCLDTETAYKNIISKKPSINIIILNWYKYAAIIALGIAIWGVLHFSIQNILENEPMTNNHPIRQSAYLLTSKGAKYNLEDSSTVVIREDGLILKKNKEGIDYHQDMARDKNRVIEYHTLVVPKGEEYSIVLADGTAIWLNSESSLTYPEIFAEQKREVKLKGEAYFKVAHDKNKPFIVISERQNVQVYGTAFNVKDYYNQEYVQTTLEEGLVKIYTKNNESSTFIYPGQQAALADNELKVRNVDVYQYLAWKDGIIASKKERLEDIMKNVSRCYNVEICYLDQNTKDFHFTTWFKKERGIEYLINQLNATNKLNIKLKNNTLEISNKK